MNDASYAEDRIFGDKFMPEIKAILGQFLLTTDYEREDCEHNTDLIVLKMDSTRIGVRIRRHCYWQYNDEFTIRYSKNSGQKTEFAKIIEGWGDYFFYGFADEEETHLIKWIIGDFKAFRKFILNQTYIQGRDFLRRNRHTVIQNGDTFLALRYDDVPGFVVADSEHWNSSNMCG